MTYKILFQKKWLIIMSFLILSTGCGFHLRGYFTISEAYQRLKFIPDQPSDPFQRSLRQALIMNNVEIIDECDPRFKETTTLAIMSQGFSERVVAYGKDAQANQAALEFKVNYQITDASGKELIPCTTIQVQREFTLNPNQVLATNNERDRVRADLIIDASTQLMRQLSVAAR